MTMVGAGLPQIAQLAGEAKPYSERLFTFPAIGNLTDEQSHDALAEPARGLGVRWEPSALDVASAATFGPWPSSNHVHAPLRRWPRSWVDRRSRPAPPAGPWWPKACCSRRRTDWRPTRSHTLISTCFGSCRSSIRHLCGYVGSAASRAGGSAYSVRSRPSGVGQPSRHGTARHFPVRSGAVASSVTDAGCWEVSLRPFACQGPLKR